MERCGAPQKACRIFANTELEDYVRKRHQAAPVHNVAATASPLAGLGALNSMRNGHAAPNGACAIWAAGSIDLPRLRP